MEILSIQDALKVMDLNEATAGKGTVIVTGATGQDGSHMIDYLLANTDYNVIGGARRLSVPNHENLRQVEGNPRFKLVYFDLSDAHAIDMLVRLTSPRYFINFAAQTHVKVSWDLPAQTWDVNTTGVLHCLEALRVHGHGCRFYNAGSSEEFGDVAYCPQDEKHPMRPRSPYAASKVAARQLVKVYRESYGMYAVQGWLFNHEGTRRGKSFVTRKITSGVATISNAIQTGQPWEPLELGTLDAGRDWSDAEDFMDAIWKMLNQQDNVSEYVVGSGESHSIRDFVETAFGHVGLKGFWKGSGLEETYRVSSNVPHSSTERILVKINPAYFRPAEVDMLRSDSSRIRNELGWAPKGNFESLVKKMVNHDLAQLK